MTITWSYLRSILFSLDNMCKPARDFRAEITILLTHVALQILVYTNVSVVIILFTIP